MEWYTILLIIGTGILVGFINTLAGSGSLISLPLLMFLGLPATVANGTNRIAILLQNVVAVGSFKQQKVLDIRSNLILALPAVAGAVVGAQIAVNINEIIMKYVIGGLLVFMFFIILLKPSVWIKGQADKVNAKPGFFKIIVFLAIGFYGGFIQAGVGFFLLAGLVLSAGYHVVKANAVKVLIVLLYTPFALAVFIFNEQVNYSYGLILACGNMIGAFVASRFAVSWGPKVIRYILLIIILAAAMYLLGFIDFFIDFI